MAGDWIKMRGGLFNSPKLIGMSRRLHENAEFREWLTPGGSGPINGQVVSDQALRSVTGALLCVTWSWSREYGKLLPNGDCLLPHIVIDDIDGIGGAPGLGEAMEYVGWAVESEQHKGVILPKFFVQHNVPLNNAEKQKAYRERKKASALSSKTSRDVTEPLPRVGNENDDREEKRREEKKEYIPLPLSGNSPTETQAETQPDFDLTPEGLAGLWKFHRKGTHNKLDDPRHLLDVFGELIRTGTPAETIRSEIADPARNKTEAIFRLEERLRPNAKHSNGRPVPTEEHNAELAKGLEILRGIPMPKGRLK